MAGTNKELLNKNSLKFSQIQENTLQKTKWKRLNYYICLCMHY